MSTANVIDAWPRSAALWERSRRSLGGGVSTGMRASMKPHPLFFERGHGSKLHDVDGHEYTDYVLGWGPVILGHAHPALLRAVSTQLPDGQTFGAGHHLEYRAAEAVLAAIPGVERVLWSNTGSEAVQTALRLARAVTGRRRWLKFEGHYHGWTDPALVGYRPGVDGSLGGVGTRGQQPAVLEDVVLVRWNDLDAVRDALADPANDIAAVFCEPVLCNTGVLAPCEGFLAGLRELCDRAGSLLVFDEVITGFRIARGGAVERYGVLPDLVVLAKAIAGGFPLAAIAGRADIIDEVVAGVLHAGTYNGNPIVLAAALATIAELGQPGVHARFEDRATELADGLRNVYREVGVPATVHHVGPVVQCIPGVEQATTTAEYLAADWPGYDRVLVELLRRGVFTLPGGRWYLSTAHDEADVARTVEVFGDAVTAAATAR